MAKRLNSLTFQIRWISDDIRINVIEDAAMTTDGTIAMTAFIRSNVWIRQGDGKFIGEIVTELTNRLRQGELF